MNEIDQYIRSFPEETQAILKNIRNQIKRIVPEVDELIAYGMPSRWPKINKTIKNKLSS